MGHIQAYYTQESHRIPKCDLSESL